jgi:hypothetical protein
MGFDLVTWVPAIGGGGDNNYNVPGATKLDGTIDTGNQCTIQAGDSSGFSATPTIPQLNASSGFNQIAGAYNRRALTFNSAFGTSLASVAYVVAGAFPLASDFINLLSKINILRNNNSAAGFQNEGWVGTLAWPISTPTAGQPIKGHHLAFLRKALAISGTIKINLAGKQYTRTDNPYGTHTSEAITTASPTAGQVLVGSVTSRYRSLLSAKIPEWLTSGLASQQITDTFNGLTGTDVMGTFDVYACNSDRAAPSLTPAYNGDFYNSADHFEASFSTSSAALQTMNVTASYIYAAAGRHMSYLYVGSREYGNTASTANDNVDSDGSNPVFLLTF